MISGSVKITGGEQIEKFFEMFTPERLLDLAKPAVKAEADRALGLMKRRVKRGLYFAQGLQNFANYRAYERSLTVAEYGGRREWVWRVGVPEGMSIGGMSGDLLGRQIEYGTSRYAPLPHIRPLHLELSNDTAMKARVTAAFAERVDEWLRSVGVK